LRVVPEPSTHGERLASISKDLVGLHTRYYGKGPVAAKTYLVDDAVICVLREGFTTVEKTLIDEGQPEAVHQIRRTFQSAMKAQFVGAVEAAMDRKVVAYMSQIHVDPDLAVEFFLLESGEQAIARHEHELSAGDHAT
jgi:uncharacterized protein YbcI